MVRDSQVLATGSADQVFRQVFLELAYADLQVTTLLTLVVR